MISETFLNAGSAPVTIAAEAESEVREAISEKIDQSTHKQCK
jgi:hypothetical protein